MPSERIQRQIDRLLDEAEAAVQAANWELARERAQAVLRLDPANADAQTYLRTAERNLTLPDADLTPGPSLPVGAGEQTGAGGVQALPPQGPRFAVVDDLQALAALQDEEAAQDEAVYIAGRYQVLATLGQGGMGIVYRARDTRLGRTVALKTILPRALTNAQASRRFFREAEALARLNHPHVLTLYDSGQDGDVHFLVMELGGRDLTRVLEQR